MVGIAVVAVLNVAVATAAPGIAGIPVIAGVIVGTAGSPTAQHAVDRSCDGVDRPPGLCALATVAIPAVLVAVAAEPIGHRVGRATTRGVGRARGLVVTRPLTAVGVSAAETETLAEPVDGIAYRTTRPRPLLSLPTPVSATTQSLTKPIQRITHRTTRTRRPRTSSGLIRTTLTTPARLLPATRLPTITTERLAQPINDIAYRTTRTRRPRTTSGRIVRIPLARLPATRLL